MNSILISNAQIVTPDGVIPNGSIRVEDGRIKQVGSVTDNSSLPGQVLDVEGAYVMPGIVDIHTDAMDMEIVPRPGADIPIGVAFRELERKMCSCGITTVYHSLHLGYETAESQSRSRYTRADIFREVHAAAMRPGLIRNKIHLRFERRGVGAYEQCLDLMRAGVVDLLSVMDHTPGQGQFTKETFKAFLLAQGKSEDQFHKELLEHTTRPRIEGDRLETMVQTAKACGLPVASHDDDTIAQVDSMLSIGVSICEFPINMETARYAKKMGMHVAGGASNILRGGSLSGNLDITNAVLEGAVDVLCSDYYPAAILHSVFKLHRDFGLPLHAAVNLATLNPAESAGLDETLGSLETGKEADLLVVQLRDDLPMVTHSMVSGIFVMQTATR